MANGKIIYTPIPTVALLLDGAHTLSLDDAAFNFGANDFAVDLLFRVDADIPDPSPWIISKAVAGSAGWAIAWDDALARLVLYLSDGTNTVVLTSTGGSCPKDVDLWCRVAVDRGGLASFRVNNVAAGGGSIAAVTGSLDNSEPLRLGGQTVSDHLFTGRIDFIRFDVGRLLPAAWVEEEWYRIKYGCSRDAEDFEDFLAAWTFYGQSLVDIANGHALTWQGGGSPAYAAGWPGCAGPIEYLFGENYTRNWKCDYLDLDDNQRLADGAAFNKPHPNQKKTFHLSFKKILPPQQAAFEGAWVAKQPVKFFLDADRPQERGAYFIMKYPLLNQVFSNTVDAELDLEQA